MTEIVLRRAAALEKGLDLFLALVEDGGTSPLAEVAARVGFPRSTAQRLAAAFLRAGLLGRIGRGRYAGGLRLAELGRAVDARAVFVAAARDPVRRLARALRTTAHLGVLEGDMVTYLVKAHGGGPEVLTRELIQLEAYCSGVGKVLLAHLPEAERQAYLASGPFVALTPATLVDPAALGRELTSVRTAGVAQDRAELELGLYCAAVPVRGPGGRVQAAISVSSRTLDAWGAPEIARLRACAREVETRLGAPPMLES